MPAPTSIFEAFRLVAGRFPDRIAAIDGDRSLSYAQLAQSAAKVAARLRVMGVVRGQRVGLYAPRSIESISAILGTLKLGATYVPFDPSYPHNLLEFQCADSEPAAVLVHPTLRANAPFWRAPTAHLDEILVGPAEAAATENGISAAIHADDAAYIMYTSGSTGRPKGVIVPQRAVLRLVLDNDFAQLGPEEVLLQLAPLTFDASTFEIWGALLNGGRLAIVSNPYPSLDDIAAVISQHHVTTLWLTAGVFHLMIDHRLQALQPLRQLLAGGDVLSPRHVAAAVRALPGCQLINGYGPTENTTFSCCYRIPKDFDAAAPLPIGTPIRQTQIYIVDEQLRPTAPGVAGELLVGGAGLALGYLNRPELTAERFIAHPFDSTPGARLYRTGDRVRTRPDGNLEFLGRVDRQVKINGKRVELDEIEACIRSYPLVADVAVLSPPADATTGTRRLVAFVTLKSSPEAWEPALRQYLRAELPDYMIPAAISRLDALPLSATGKVDRLQLAARVISDTSPILTTSSPTLGSNSTIFGEDDRTGAAPGIETRLAQAWRAALGNRPFGLDDNFFDMGGTSLQLLQVHASIRELADNLTVVEMFQFPTLRALARRLNPASGPTAAAPAPATTRSSADRARQQREALARRRSGNRSGV